MTHFLHSGIYAFVVLLILASGEVGLIIWRIGVYISNDGY